LRYGAVKILLKDLQETYFSPALFEDAVFLVKEYSFIFCPCTIDRGEDDVERFREPMPTLF
jgi:hypothetical protein